RTTDGGENWAKASGTGGEINDIITFESGKVIITRRGNESGKGIYQSPNGNSFTKINSGAFPANFHRVEIANCKNFPNVVYALFDNQNDTASVLCKSSDGGVTWIQL